jgi:hypothetical protein
MTRLTLALAVWMGVVSAAAASLAAPRGFRTAGKDLPPLPAPALAVRAPERPAKMEAIPEVVLTEQTEVLLNGKPCKYADVPGHARVVLLELAEDNKTVLKIHFRTGK